MKRILAVAMAVVIATGMARAQEKTNMPTRAKLAKLVQAYKMALNSENVGVRSSALFQLAKIKSRYPSCDLSELMSPVERLSKKDAEPILRVQANLTFVYLGDETLAQKIKTGEPDDPIVFYNTVQTELSMALLVK
jgi:hypothetical protein